MQYIKNRNEDIYDISNKDKIRFIFSVCIGVLIMFIHSSKWYMNICSNIVPNEYRVAELLIVLCGIVTIFLNKYFISKSLKVRG